MIIRREQPADLATVHRVTAAAFAEAAYSAPPLEPGGDPGEVTLLAWLRADEAWIPELSLVAVADGAVVGHVVCTRAWVGERPALGLGPLSVLPSHQRAGVGSALMHAMLGAAQAREETVVGLLGDPRYYGRFGFVPARTLGIDAPEPSWGDYFQARVLSAAGDGGDFRYAAPYSRL